MKACEHARAMLTWWHRLGLDRVDLAARCPSGAMMWHRDLSIDALPLKWAGAQNVRRAEIYVRPARQYAWPVVFLDDVAPPRARAVANKYDALVVETSPAGGCHVWLACRQPLAEAARRDAQKWLAERIGADPGSTSGEHLGRLAGFKNWKRGGPWVNVLVASHHGRRWDATAVPTVSAADNSSVTECRRRSTDSSPSGREWGWVCGLLESGCPPERVYLRLLERACLRRGADAPRYARKTLAKALQRVRSTGPRETSEEVRVQRVQG